MQTYLDNLAFKYQEIFLKLHCFDNGARIFRQYIKLCRHTQSAIKCHSRLCAARVLLNLPDSTVTKAICISDSAIFSVYLKKRYTNV